LNQLPYLAALCVACVFSAQHVETCCAQTKSVVTELATINAKTRWSLRTVPAAVVSSSIVRLGDVVKPLDPKMPLWQRMKSAPIAMFPVNVNNMTIDRDRLDKAIRKAEATPRSIDWFGPSQIKVSRQKLSATRSADKRPIASQIAQASYEQAGTDAITPVVDAVPNISDSEARRISHWIRIGIDRGLPAVADSFEIQIDRNQTGLARLVSISGVTNVELVDKIVSGQCRFRVVGRSTAGPVEAVIVAHLIEHPKVVVPRTTLARGHRITERDLTLAPIHPDKFSSGQVIDPQAILGMEVRVNLRADRPIRIGDIGSPILIHRGDLVELRVLSGGVTVKTNAKSLGDGSESDLVEIETMRPRKRLVARVVQTGLVEIVTRSPAVRYRENFQR